jgi:phosphopantetheinyl transferase
MPLIHHQQINAFTKIGVWHITEAENFFIEHVPMQRNITHPHKRLQHLAGRFLLLELFPAFPLALIQIADTRKPFLENEAYHFSISHCGDYASAIVSTKNRVGVDVEIPHEKIERIQHKFLSENEEKLIGKYENKVGMLTMAWSMKEAMFKWYGLGEVDFIKHMQLFSLAKNDKGYTALCNFTKAEKIELRLENMLIGGNNLAWVVT